MPSIEVDGIVDFKNALASLEDTDTILVVKPNGGGTDIPTGGYATFADIANAIRVHDNAIGVVYAYYYEGTMYSDAEHTTALDPDAVTLYIDITDGGFTPYLWRESDGFRVFEDASPTATPTITVNVSDKTVELACADTTATIYYTTDGSYPSRRSTAYTAPFACEDGTVVRAAAIAPGFSWSEVASETVTFIVTVGVVWNMASSETALTRLTPATDPLGVVNVEITTEPVAEITGTQEGSSPFDEFNVWGGMKPRNFASGAPGAWLDESGFSRTTGDVMVWIPEFFVRVVNDATSNQRYYYVSESQLDGFSKHPGSGMYIGAYETAGSSSGVYSRSGQTVLGSVSPANHQTYARNKGANWQLNMWVQNEALKFLTLVEFADFDTQTKIGWGNNNANASGSAYLTTGSTDGMTYHTGRPAGTANMVGVRYRWIENPWGNYYEWISGVANYQGQLYVQTDPTKIAFDSISGMVAVGSAVSTSAGGYISGLDYDTDNQWAIGIPTAFAGSTTTFISDYGYRYYNSNTTCYLPRVGGYRDVTSGHAGAWYFAAVAYTSSNSSAYSCGRLSYAA